MKELPSLTDTQLLAILKDFNRKPIRSRGEVGMPDGSRVLVPYWKMQVYYSRPISKATRLGYLDFFTRCGCDGPCVCETNGYYITDAGKAFLKGQEP